MIKQVIVIRKDLDLSAGKSAAQAAHASNWATRRADNELVSRWGENSDAKIVLGVNSEKKLRDLAQEARENDLPVSVVSDEGRTEIQEGTTTAIAIGPDIESEIDKITSDLPLYK